MTKPFSGPAHAAESGLLSSELVSLGWTAAEQILEAEARVWFFFFMPSEAHSIPVRLWIVSENLGRSLLPVIFAQAVSVGFSRSSRNDRVGAA